MGIFSRMSDIINSNLNSLLDNAEDPEKMARMIIQEMEDTLVDVRSDAVKSIAIKKELLRKREKLEENQNEWSDKAEFAIEKGRDDLARGAISARRKLEESGAFLDKELVQVEESLKKYNEDLEKLQSKLNEAKARRKAMEMRLNNAEKRVKIRKTLYDGRVDEALSRYDQVERKIDEMEAGAEVYDMGKEKSLEEQFAELEAEGAVESELKALKKKMEASKAE